MLPNDKFEADFAMNKISKWKTGGKVRYFKEVNTAEELASTLAYVRKNNLNWAIVGRMSNILFTDEYMDGVVIKLGKGFTFFTYNQNIVTVGAATYSPSFVRSCVAQGLAGIEHIVGVPASLGGIVTMNGGSCRKSVSEHITTVKSIDFDGNTIIRNNEQCEFGYRESIFKYKREIITECSFELTSADKKELRKTCLNTLRSRRLKFPLKKPNCGSVFKSSPTMYAEIGPPGLVIEKCGLKGNQIGGAQINPLHANFITNEGAAKSQDILDLMKLCIDTVLTETGHTLIPEVRFVDKNLNIKNIEL
ncbi:UDP-N-acetylmuramate dehydrogenase [Paraglaciecola sp. L3A3]|uniref:UDP-N-acetylmuramate dehydrogenase n=1 Tax=Paraglaciecola sp. L3A3 TaxID=2686358 RepID=UPI00131D72B7|nr:UDP-N-acetylmuramate dehydrogenase [Paraglaciecola sp. L3A3]